MVPGASSYLFHSKHSSMNCRPGCGACCTAPSISSAIPGMPQGKPAGVRCVQLDDQQRCLIFGRPGRPAVCGQLMPSADMCGASAGAAMVWLTQLENATRPGA
jgi:uncharacterized protein